jgi:hypothetical protein
VKIRKALEQRKRQTRDFMIRENKERPPISSSKTIRHLRCKERELSGTATS